MSEPSYEVIEVSPNQYVKRSAVHRTADRVILESFDKQWQAVEWLGKFLENRKT